MDITVLSAKPFHDVRVRNYETDLSACRIPLADLLDPAGVAHVATEVTAIDTAARTVTTSGGATYGYDRLVLASGSRVLIPAVPGLREFGFDVDTYDGGPRTAAAPARAGRRSADAGGGYGRGGRCRADRHRGGLRAAGPAAELFSRAGVTPRVVLVDRNPRVGSDMGASARPVIERALSDNGVETRTGVSVADGQRARRAAVLG